MFSKYFTVAAALVAVASAAPVVPRGCTEGQYNCIDGKTYAQCISGGTWGTTMQTAPGTVCNVGISENPFIPVDGSSGGSPPPPPAQTSVAAPPPAQTSNSPPPPPPAKTTDSPPPPAKTTDSPPPPPAKTSSVSPPAYTTSAPPPAQPTQPTTPSGDCTNNAAGGKFADESCWLSWEAMKAKYLPILGTGCTSWGANNSPDETAEIFSAIEASAGAVDKRFILSLVAQESTGCVRVITTNNGVRNPGLLQDSNGAHTCNDNGSIQSPCPKSQIGGMIDDGVNQGDNNLAKALKTANAAGFTGAKGYAVASRIYNSGSYDANNLANGLGSTGPYVDQILNRLTGTQV